MWDNLINPREIPYLIRRLRREPALIGVLLSRVPLTGRRRVQAAWAHTENVTRHWWDVPAVVERWNRMVTGDPACPPHRYVADKYLGDRDAARALSLGCGGGTKEMDWIETGRLASLEAYDLSERRIRDARQEATRRGLDHQITFHVGDVHRVPLRDRGYDLIVADHALHHFSPLRPLLRRLHDALAPDGILFVNDFVGPSRFQWTDRQMEAANSLLALLPLHYRRLVGSRHPKVPLVRPSRLGMILRDPSEAVESSNILPLLEETFDVREIRGYGGSVLHLLLSGIAHHFIAPDERGRRLLELCFAAEDTLLESGDVAHDFVIAVCGRRAAR